MLSISLIYMVGFPSIWIIVIIFNLRCNILGFSLIWISLKSLIYIAGFLPICIWFSWLAFAGGLALAQHHSWPCVRPAEEERQVFGKSQGDDDDQLKRELSILNSDRTENQMLQIAPIVLLSEIVPGRGHRLCKSSQLQRALRRVIYGWQRISKVKISRIFVLLQMDFCLQGSQRAYFWLRWIARSGKTPSKPPLYIMRNRCCYLFVNHNLDPKSEFRNVEKIKTIGATFMAASGLNPFIRYPAIMTSITT